MTQYPYYRTRLIPGPLADVWPTVRFPTRERETTSFFRGFWPRKIIRPIYLSPEAGLSLINATYTVFIVKQTRTARHSEILHDHRTDPRFRDRHSIIAPFTRTLAEYSHFSSGKMLVYIYREIRGPREG